MKMLKTGFLAALCVLSGAASGAAALERAGDLLVEIDASAVTAADGAAVGSIANTGSLGGTFVPTAGNAGAVYSADVAGIPAFTFANVGSIMTNTVLPCANLFGGNPWSVEAWVYNPSYTATIETYFAWTPRDGFADNSRTVMECRYCSTVSYAVEHYNSNLAWGGTPAVAGAWHYLVATRAADGTECFYVDGRMREKTSIDLNLRTDGSFTLGGVWVTTASSESWAYPFTGSLASLRVHSGTLTAAQVCANYESEADARINRWAVAAPAEGAPAPAWDVPANWTRGIVPEDVLIDNGGAAAFNSGDVVLNSLIVPNGGVIIDGANVTVHPAQVQDVCFAQGEGSFSSFTLRSGSLVQTGTNDIHIYIARCGGTGSAIIGGGTEQACLEPDRDLIVASSGGTAAMTIVANGCVATPDGWTYIANGDGAKAVVTVDGGIFGSSTIDKRLPIGNNGGDGELILNSGVVNAKTAIDFSCSASATTGRSVFRMNGGEAYVGKFAVANAATEGRVYFNGGVVHAVTTQNNYMNDLDSAVVSAGGVTFDVPAGVTVRIDQALLEDSESTGGVIRKTGSGRLVLAGANTVSTPVDLQEGELFFANAEALASFPSVTAAPGTAVGGMWTGGSSAVLAKLSPTAQATLVLTSVNAADDVNFTGRANMTFKTEGTFSYTGAFTPVAADAIVIDVGTGTLTYGMTIADAGASPTAVTVRGSGGKLIVTGAQTFTGGITVDNAAVQFDTAAALPATGAITLANHARLDFMKYQDVAQVVARLTAGSEGLLILHDPTEITGSLDFSQLPGVVLGTTTNITSSAVITPGNGAYHFGGGNTTHTGPSYGIQFSNLADAGGATRVVIGEPGITWLASGNTYSGGTVVTNKGILYLAGADGLGAVPATPDPDNLFVDGGIIRGGAGNVTLPATRGITIGAGGATFHQWSIYTFDVLGDLHGTGTMTMSDSGWVTFAGAGNDFTGNLVVNGGANTRIGDGETFSWEENTGATIHGCLALKTNHDLMLGQTFTGTGTLRKEGAGTLTLTGPQSYAATQIAEGTLRVKDATVLPSGSGRGVVEIETPGTLDTEGKALTVGALKGYGSIANSSGEADVLRVSSANVNGEFAGTIADTITIEKAGANTQTFSSESSSVSRIPALVLREGVAELNLCQAADKVTMAGGTLRIRNGFNGLTGRYYVRTAAQMGTAASTLSTLAGINAFEASLTPSLIESSMILGPTFDTGAKGERFPETYRNADNYIIVWRGLISIPTAGTWTFALDSDDGSVLYINGEKIIDNLFDQSYGVGKRQSTRTPVELTKGDHEIVIGYYEKTGENVMTAFVTRPGATADEILPSSMLTSTVLGSKCEVAHIEGDAGTIVFSDIGLPNVAFTQNDDVTLAVSVKGANPNSRLIKRGAGTLTFAGMDNDFNGEIVVENGTLNAGGSGQIGIVDLSSGTTLVIPNGNGADHDYLRARYYTGQTSFDYENMKDYAKMKAFFNGLVPTTDTTSFSAGETLDFGSKGERFATGTDNFLLYLSGRIYIPQSGDWQFAVDSDDGSAVWIDGKAVVLRAGDTGMTGGWGTSGTPLSLARGLHEIRVAYREATGDQGLRVAMKGPGTTDYAYIPQGNLFRDGSILNGLSGAAGSRAVISDAMLTIAQAGDTTFAGTIEGMTDARIVKCEEGTLSLTGDVDGYAGVWQIDEGALRFATGGEAHVAKLTGGGKLIIDGGTDLVVAASDFTGDVEVIDGSFTIAATGTKHLSGFFGTVTGDILGITGAGRIVFNLTGDRLGTRTVELRGGATGSVSEESFLGGADVSLDGGTLQVQKELMPGTTMLADFSDPDEWQFNGDAAAKKLNGKDYLFLVQCADTRVGTAFLKTKVNVSQPWHASFTYHVATNGVVQAADGFSFMIQNSTPTAKGGAGGCTGGAVYEIAEKVVITPAVAVAQAIYGSAKLGIFNNGWALPGVGFAEMTGFDNTKDVDYVITYDGTRLEVEASQDGKMFTCGADVDLATACGGGEAYVGFTASTGGAIAEMGIFNFEMRNVSEASADFSQTDLKVVSSGTLRTQFDEAVGFGTLVVDGDATLTLGDVGGTGSGAIEIGTLDCRAGGMLTVTGGSLAARNGMLTLIVPTPLDAGKVVKLIDLNGSQWQGPLAVNVVDANGNSLKARAFVSGGALKLSTADGTVIYFR